MQNRMLIAILVLSTIVATRAAFAGDEFDSGAVAFYDYAVVTDVEPIYREVPISTRVRECRAERPNGARGRPYSYTPAIVGGLVGGVVGNQFGRGRGKTVLTVTGAALGASLGHDVQRRHRVGYTRHRHTDCSTFERIRYEREIQGYQVRYNYQGQTFTTVTHEHPGQRMRLRVGVSPVVERYAEVGAGHVTCGKQPGDDYCY